MRGLESGSEHDTSKHDGQSEDSGRLVRQLSRVSDAAELLRIVHLDMRTRKRGEKGPSLCGWELRLEATCVQNLERAQLITVTECKGEKSSDVVGE